MPPPHWGLCSTGPAQETVFQLPRFVRCQPQSQCELEKNTLCIVRPRHCKSSHCSGLEPLAAGSGCSYTQLPSLPETEEPPSVKRHHFPSSLAPCIGSAPCLCNNCMLPTNTANEVCLCATHRRSAYSPQQPQMAPLIVLLLCTTSPVMIIDPHLHPEQQAQLQQCTPTVLQQPLLSLTLQN